MLDWMSSSVPTVVVGSLGCLIPRLQVDPFLGRDAVCSTAHSQMVRMHTRGGGRLQSLKQDTTEVILASKSKVTTKILDVVLCYGTALRRGKSLTNHNFMCVNSTHWPVSGSE